MPAAKKTAGKTGGYLVHVGIDYPPLQRAEPGDTVTDLPKTSIPWLLAQGAITKQEA